MSVREWMYGALATAGATVPWYYNLRFVSEGGSFFDIPLLVRSALANRLTSSLTFDLLIAFAVFTLWVVVESRRLGLRRAWIYPFLGIGIAFAFALPLFLLIRERHMRARSA